MVKKWHRLHSLSKSHLVCQNDVSVVLESSQHPIEPRNLVIFALLATPKRGHQVLLVVVLEIARRWLHSFELEQLREHLSSLYLLSWFGVKSFSCRRFLLEDLQDLLVRVSEAHHLLSWVVVEWPIESFEVFNLGLGYILGTNHGCLFPGTVDVRKVHPLHKIDWVYTSRSFINHLLNLVLSKVVIASDTLQSLVRFQQPSEARLRLEHFLLPDS